MKTFLSLWVVAVVATTSRVYQSSLRNSNFIEEKTSTISQMKPKYYFRIALPIGKFAFSDVVPMVKEGSILEFVETRVSDSFDKVGMADLRFGWDGRLNPSEASTPGGIARLKSLFNDPENMVLQFNVQGSLKPGFSADSVQKEVQAIQSSDYLTTKLSDIFEVLGDKFVSGNATKIQGCHPPWEGEKCDKFSDAGMVALRNSVAELASFEGEHHSDFTLFLLNSIDTLEKELKTELATIAAASGRTHQVATACCEIWQASDGITNNFRYAVSTSLRKSISHTQDVLVDNQKTCGLPQPNTPPAVGTKLGEMETPLLSTMQKMHARVTEWTKYMAGSHFANSLTDKMNLVKYDLEALVHQSLIVLYNHDFVQERCGNLAASLRSLIDQQHFVEFNRMLVMDKDSEGFPTISLPIDDNEDSAPINSSKKDAYPQSSVTRIVRKRHGDGNNIVLKQASVDETQDLLSSSFDGQ